MLAQYVTLGAADEVFGAPVERVQEILDARPIARLPHMPAAMLGIVDVRGRTIPVVDLRRALGFAEAADTEATRLLVLTVHRDAGDTTTLGVRTDRVFEVTGLDGEVEPDPTGAGGACVAGIGRRGGGFVTLLDVDRLFGTLALA